MKQEIKTQITALLMAFTWLLILFLAVQWLRATYDAERETLRKDLGRYFNEAKVQVMDSTLVLHLIEPMFNTKPMVDSGAGSRKSVVYSINVTDTAGGMARDITWKNRMKADSGNITLQSIRLIVGSVADSSRMIPDFREILPDTADTSLFRQIFLEKLDDQGLLLKVRVTTGAEGDSSVKGKSKIVVSERMFDSTVNAEITGFSWFLAKRIFPQLLFSILLLGLTAGAFIFTFRSLKKQIMLNELRDGFLRNITHELKTPVATVKVALESLGRYDLQSDPRVTRDYLGMASQEMDRLDRLIGRVLDISLLEEKKPVATLKNSDLKSLVSHVINSMKLRFEESKATVRVDAEDTGYFCLLEELYVEGILVNMIDNSLKYAADIPVIHIGLVQDERSVTLTLRDFGPGIPAEYLGRVFEKFFRVPTGDRHNVKGHGLGLTYVWHVMEQHGGRVHAENMMDGGCRFTLRFNKEGRNIKHARVK